MRSLLVSHTGAIGGSNEVILTLLRNRPSGVDPVCAFLDDGPIVASAQDLGIEAMVVRAGRTREVWRVPWVVSMLAGLIHRRGVDVVFAHASKAQVYASPAATVAGVPNLWFNHEVTGLDRSAPGKVKALQKVAARLPTRTVVCNSEYVCQLYLQRWRRASARRVYPGIALDDLPVRRHVSDRDVHIVVVGRLQRWKRVELALEAFAKVRAKEPTVHLTIVGDARPDVDADYPDALRRRVAALGIEQAVTFMREAPVGGDPIATADVLLHVADREPFGIPLVDALARGVPVIAPPEGGPAEIVRDGVDGLLVDPTDVPLLATAVLALVQHPERRAIMGAAGHRRALERFGERRMAAEAWQIVAETVNGAGR